MILKNINFFKRVVSTIDVPLLYVDSQFSQVLTARILDIYLDRLPLLHFKLAVNMVYILCYEIPLTTNVFFYIMRFLLDNWPTKFNFLL